MSPEARPAAADDPTIAVRLAQARADTAREELRRAVEAARAAGVSWAELGRAMGTTRQAAFKRFGADAVEGNPPRPRPRSPEDVPRLTEDVFALLASGRTPELRAAMTEHTAAVLTRQRLDDLWVRARAEHGQLLSCRDTRVELPGGASLDDDLPVLGTVVGVTTLVCEAGEWEGRVAVDADRRVVGLLVVPPGTEALPF